MQPTQPRGSLRRGSSHKGAYRKNAGTVEMLFIWLLG